MALPIPGLDIAGPRPMATEFLAHYGLPHAVVAQLREHYGATLLPVQEQAVRAGLFEGRNLLVCSPTSSGKTLVGELACLHAAVRNRAAILLVPTKALANEKTQHLQEVYGPLGFRILVSTGDRRDDDRRLVTGRYHVAVVVYEKLMALLVEHPALLCHVGTAVADEVQLLFDEERGARVELLLAQLRHTEGLQLLALSAVAADERLAEWLGAEHVRDGRRPVSLRQGVLHHGVFYYRDQATGDEGTERILPPAIVDEHEALLGAALELAGRGESTLVFLPTKPAVHAWAGRAAERGDLAPARSTLAALADAPDTTATRLLRELLAQGVALHHGDLSYEHRRRIERGVAEGDIGLVFATSTLAEGINLPTVNTLVSREVLRTTAQDTAAGRPPHPARLSVAQFQNMTGRSGRLGLAGAGLDYGRGMLVAEDGADVASLLAHYVRGSGPTTEPALSRQSLEQSVAALLAEPGITTVEAVRGRLARTFSAACGGLACGTDDIAGVFDTLEAQELARREDGNWVLSARGRTLARFGVAAETVSRLDKALAWYDEHTGLLPALLHLACTPDGVAHFLPVTRREREEQLPLFELARRAAETVQENTPAVRAVLAADCRLPETVASAKKALLLERWLSNEPTLELERQYRVLAGAVTRLSERLSWLAQAWLYLARLRGHAPAACRRLDRLATCLGAGVPWSAASLAPLTRCGMERTHILRLMTFGIARWSDLASLDPAIEIEGVPNRLLVKAIRMAGERRKQSMKDCPNDEGPPPPTNPESLRNSSVAEVRHTTEKRLPLRFDGERPELFHVGPWEVRCTPTERRLLEVVMHGGRGTVDWTALLNRVWGESDASQQTAYRHVSNINRKTCVATDGRIARLLATVPLHGLRLCEQVCVVKNTGRIG